MSSVSADSTPFCLDDLVINSPCPMDWELMDGDKRTRFCGRCEKSVYNISEMSPEDALALVGGGSPVCGRIYRRPDGTVVTSECDSLGATKPSSRFQFSISALLVLLTLSSGVFASAPWLYGKLQPIVARWFETDMPQPVGSTIIVGEMMGSICIDPPQMAPEVFTDVSAIEAE